MADPHGVRWDVIITNSRRQPRKFKTIVCFPRLIQIYDEKVSSPTATWRSGRRFVPGGGLHSSFSATGDGGRAAIRTIQGSKHSIEWAHGIDIAGSRDELPSPTTALKIHSSYQPDSSATFACARASGQKDGDSVYGFGD